MATLAPSTILRNVAHEIVSDVLLLSHVWRDQTVKRAKSNFTYGQLEEQGVIVLETSRDSQLTVLMPYYLFQFMDSEDPLTESLRTVCNIVQRQDFMNWQTLENLHCNIESSREMVMARRTEEGSEEGSLTSLRKFCCVPVVNDFDFLLRRDCPVETARYRFPSTDWHIHDWHIYGGNLRDCDYNDMFTLDKATDSYVKM
jgi:hypothetical protein